MYVCNDLFRIEHLSFLDFDDFVQYLDSLTPESGMPGGNKRKRSPKRKSSKKRSTCSKKMCIFCIETIVETLVFNTKKYSQHNW